MSSPERVRLAQPVPFVRRIVVRNYRSIAECDVTLGPLTVLLGFNASGKSNFVDALRFVADALQRSPAHAVAERGGLDRLLHRRAGVAAESFEIKMDLGVRVDLLGYEGSATYGFTIGADPGGESEAVAVSEDGTYLEPESSIRPLMMPVEDPPPDRLRLPAYASKEGPGRTVERALRRMRFYEFESAALGALDDTRTKEALLGPAGEHLGAVLGEMARRDPSGKERLDAYLGALVPGALAIDERREGRYSTVQGRFATAGGEELFLRESLSEGTLRAAAALAALLQPQAFSGRIPLLAMEEPETALHPSGVGALYEALDDAAQRTQVIVTSQSSDLLDNEYARLQHIRAVEQVDGATRIGPVSPSGAAIVERGLMTLSELHRSGQMRPAAEVDA